MIGLRLSTLLCLLLAIPAAAEHKPRKAKKVALPAAVHTHDIRIRGAVAFVGDSVGLTVYAVDDPTAPKRIGRLPLRGSAHVVRLAGDSAYVAAGTRGLYRIDISDPAEPELVQHIETPGNVRDVVVQDQIALLADGNEGLRVIDLTLAERPIRRATISSRAALSALALADGRLATAEGRGGMRLFDVKHPDRPVELGLRLEKEGIRDVAWAGDLLLLAEGRDGVGIYRVDSDRLAPLARVETPGIAEFVSVHDSLLLISSGGQLQLVDISDPRNPQERSRVRPHRAAATGPAVQAGDKVYVTLDVAGFGILDVADPSRPIVLHPTQRRFKISFPEAD